MSYQRLDKILARQGSNSRNDVKKMIKKGEVSVNGMPVKDCAFKVDADTDVISVCGQSVQLKEHIYIMMNKPKGVVSASDGKGEITVVDILPDSFKRNGLFPAGRLDKDTTGFVLITDDGAFAHKMLSPSGHVKKVYVAQLAEPLRDGAENEFKNGVVLADGYECLPADIEMNKDRLVATVTLREGKYHQIKRMFAANGNRVVELKRISIGGVALDENLAEGECRELTECELVEIFK